MRVAWVPTCPVNQTALSHGYTSGSSLVCFVKNGHHFGPRPLHENQTHRLAWGNVPVSIAVNRGSAFTPSATDAAALVSFLCVRKAEIVQG